MPNRSLELQNFLGKTCLVGPPRLGGGVAKVPVPGVLAHQSNGTISGFFGLARSFWLQNLWNGWQDPKMTKNLAKVLCGCGKGTKQVKTRKNVQKNCQLLKKNVIRAKRAGLDKNGSECVRGVSGRSCRGSCRGRVGGVSGRVGARVGRVSGAVSGACRARVGAKFSDSKLFSNRKRQFCKYLPEKCLNFQHFSTKTIENSKKNVRH